MRTVRVGDGNLFGAFVCDFALPGINERGKRDANKDRSSKSFHWYSSIRLTARCIDSIQQFITTPSRSTRLRYNRFCLSRHEMTDRMSLAIMATHESIPNRVYSFPCASF